MSNYQIFSDYVPVADAGTTLTLTPSEPLNDGAADLLVIDGPKDVKLKVEGPQLQLTPADIAGVYPAPNSEESPDEFLPHIALERRTLPWERVGPDGKKPWLALMLLKESEMRDAASLTYSPGSTLLSITLDQVASRDPEGYTQLRNVVGLPDNTPLNVFYIKNSALGGLRPHRDDLRYMCHMRRDLENNKDRAIVVSSRLPDAGPPGTEPEIHTAFLVSLEKRDDLYAGSRLLGPDSDKEAVFIVLHHWSFKPSQGGDFEQVIRSIAVRPNGGVLRFGNLPKEAAPGQPTLSGGFQTLLKHDGYFQDALPHTQPGTITWRSPLRPFKPPPRTQGFAIRAAPEEFEDPQLGDPLDYSHASAFELGRLLAFARPEILEDLREIHLKYPLVEREVLTKNLPPALQKPDWVSNPEWTWTEQPWSMEVDGQLQSIVKGENEFLGKGVADVGGINVQSLEWLDDVLVDLGGMNVPVPAPVTQIDIGTATSEGLGNMFPELQGLG